MIKFIGYLPNINNIISWEKILEWIGCYRHDKFLWETSQLYPRGGRGTHHEKPLAILLLDSRA